MKKGLLLSLCCLNLITANLNAEEVVGLEEDINITKISSKTDSRKDDNVQFSLEFGVKTDFWEPGLSKEEGGEELLKYDTEGLYLGYAKFKTKIYDTDVLTLEKFGTLKSSDTQSKLLNAYENDRKKDSSFQGYRASIQVMKILNYLFDTNVLDGLEYSYTTRNFMGSATLGKDSIYWFGNNPGNINTDYLEYEKDKVISFQTKFINQELLYRFGNLFDRGGDNPDGNSMRGILGVYYENWEKPTYIGNTFNGNPVLFDGKYKSTGALVGFELGSKTFNFGLKWYIGIDNEFQLANNYSASDDFDRTLGMQKADIYFIKKYPKIYSTDYFDVGFLIKGNYIYSVVTNGSSFHQKGTPEPEKKDAETLYGIGLAFDVTF
jgi:hypothetical protein